MIRSCGVPADPTPLPVCRRTVLRGEVIYEEGIFVSERSIGTAWQGGSGKLGLDPVLVGRARELARRAGQPVVDLARSHTTVSVERAVLRLAGVSGADPDGIPWVNRLVDAVVADVGWVTGWRCRCSTRWSGRVSRM